MTCEELWERVRQRERELTAAFQAELALLPYPALGHVAPVTSQELFAIELAQEKHRDATAAYQRAVLVALSLNRLHAL